jgi:hypothetical protein
LAARGHDVDEAPGAVEAEDGVVLGVLEADVDLFLALLAEVDVVEAVLAQGGGDVGDLDGGVDAGALGDGDEERLGAGAGRACRCFGGVRAHGGLLAASLPLRAKTNCPDLPHERARCPLYR